MTENQWLGNENELGLKIYHDKYQHNGESFEEFLNRVSNGDEALKNLVREKKFLLGGRTLTNRGTDSKASYFNCYSHGFVEDDYKDIMQAAMNIGLTFKGEGGQGISLSKLRPKGSPIGKEYKSDGIIPFMRIFNEVTAGTSQGGCIAEDELVLTERGYKPIKDIEVGDKVHTKAGFKDVTTKWDKGVQPVYEVTTAKGYKIRTTLDHKFCVDGFNVVPLKELNIGDKINLIANVCDKGFDFDPQAYFLANFYANGYLNQSGTGMITMNSDYKEVGDRLIAFIKSLGFNAYYNNREDEHAVRVVLTADMCRWINSHGFTKDNGYNISVPEYIMRGNDGLVLSYLSGALDSDGCYKQNNAFSYTTVSRKYAYQIFDLMKRVGFFPTISRDDRKDEPNKKPLYEVHGTFYKNISLNSVKMSIKGSSAIANSRYSTPYTMENSGISPKDAKHLEKISKTDNIGLYTYAQIENPPYSPIIFDCIRFISPAGEAHVYDIEVEDEHKFNCNGIYVSNSRKGALMLSIDAKHKEAMDFIKIKSEEGQIEKANLSLEIDDEFMEAVSDYYRKGETVVLHVSNNYSGHIVEYDVTPIEIFKALVDNSYDWADPACLFVDQFRHHNMMQYHPNYHIETCNPCGEQPLPRHGACCLASLNMSEFVEKPYTKEAYFNTSDFVKAVKIGIKTLDTLIDENYYRHPLKEQQEMSYNYRNIGLGVFGYATALMKLGMKYGDNEALEFTDQIFDLMFRTAVLESNELAKELGPFPEYMDCVLDSDIIKEHFTAEEIDRMRPFGLRNCSLLSIAPTGSISNLLNESGGCEPEFALKYTRRTIGMTGGEDTYFDVYCKAAREYMELTGDKELPSYFVSSADVHWFNRVMTQAVMQKHVDTAISSTVNLPNDATKEDIAQLYLEAWRQKLKGITIFRSGCKRMPILSTDNKKDENEEGHEVEAVELKRGDIINCSDNLIGMKRKIRTGCGVIHVQAWFDPVTGELQECFLDPGSAGGCERNTNAISRLISLSLRGGISFDDVVDQLTSIRPCTAYNNRRVTHHDVAKGTNCPSAVVNALIDMRNCAKEMVAIDDSEEVEKEEAPKPAKKAPKKKMIKVDKIEKLSVKKDKCPECGEPIVFENGCVTCKSCGWTKCD